MSPTEPFDFPIVTEDHICSAVPDTAVKKLLGTWVAARFADVDDCLSRKISNIISSETFFQEYTPDSLLGREIARFYNRLQGKPSFPPYCHLIPFCASLVPELTCNQLLFGEGKEVALQGVTKGFVEAASSLPEKSQAQLLDILSDRICVGNPLYTLQTRLRELAAQKGHDYLKYAMGLFENSSASVLRRIKQPLEKTQPTNAPLDRVMVGSSRLLISVVIAVSIEEGVSADYLLKEDYSDLAAFADRPLNADERALLSAFLTATPKAQGEAIGQVLFFHRLSSTGLMEP